MFLRNILPLSPQKVAGYPRRLISYIVHLKHSSCNSEKLALADRTLLRNNSMILCVRVRVHVIFWYSVFIGFLFNYLILEGPFWHQNMNI
jgi:hypothetical protein